VFSGSNDRQSLGWELAIKSDMLAGLLRVGSPPKVMGPKHNTTDNNQRFLVLAKLRRPFVLLQQRHPAASGSPTQQHLAEIVINMTNY
jgi:hypothetical protein